MTFEAFARSVGLVLDRAIPDAKIHRVPTVDKKSHRNGSYRWDGEFGWAQDWASMDSVAFYKADTPLEPQVARRFMDRANRERQEQASRHAEAAQKAREIIGQCGYGPSPYFAAKGIPEAQALLDSDGRIVVPMRNISTQEVQSVQWIAQDGEKRFLFGGKAADAVHILGPRSGVRWFVEGYATAWTIRAALKALYRQDAVVVTFSAGNLERVAKHGFVVADNDESKRGQQAAEKTGLPWVMPPVVGEDANDMAKRVGVRAVAELMRNVL